MGGTTQGAGGGLPDIYGHSRYLVRRKVLKLFGADFHIFDPAGQLVMFSHMKAFKLKEDIRLYAGEEMQTELLRIQARQIIDFAAAYDVNDTPSGQKVGALKRRGFKSIIRDEWILMDASDREIGVIREDNIVLALVRRTVSGLVPQSYYAEMGGTRVCTFRQNFNPFVRKITIEFPPDAGALLDRRLGIAAALLLCAIEGRQK